MFRVLTPAVFCSIRHEFVYKDGRGRLDLDILKYIPELEVRLKAGEPLQLGPRAGVVASKAEEAGDSSSIAV
jgi:hypothetical protein